MEQNYYPSKNSFANATLFFTAFAFFTIPTGFFSLPLASFGLLFSALAYRKGSALDLRLKISIPLNIICLLASIYLIIQAFLSLPTLLNDPAYRDYFNTMSEQLYGEDLDSMLENFNSMDF